MATLFRNDRSTLPAELSLVEGNSMLIKVSGLGPDKKHLQLKTNAPTMLAIQALNPDDRKLEQSIRLTVIAKDLRLDKVIEVAAYAKSGGTWKLDDGTRRLRIKILPQLQLPNPDTEAGLLARMLLVESAGPEHPRYAGAAQALECMQWMKRVLINRLNAGAHHFSKNPSATAKLSISTLNDVVRIPGQVESFNTYPALPPAKMQLIKTTMNIANDATHRGYERYRQLVEDAISVAESSEIIADPCPSGLYAWRTQGSAGPGSNFVFFRSMGGQDFYTLTTTYKSEVLKIQ